MGKTLGDCKCRMLIYGLIFCFATCFFVFFSFGCSTSVLGKGDGGMYGGIYSFVST